MYQTSRGDKRLAKNKTFWYNEFFVTDIDAIGEVFDAIITRGELKTFRSNFLKTTLSGKKVSGVLLYFYDIGIIDIVERNRHFLYKRVFDIGKAEEIQEGLPVEYNLFRFLEENTEKGRNGKPKIPRKQMMKVLYAYLRWNMKLHRPIRSKYFTPVDNLDNRSVIHGDCPLNRQQIVLTMQYGIEKGIIDVREKKRKGNIYYFKKEILEKKLSVPAFMDLLEEDHNKESCTSLPITSQPSRF
jgi:hypothetical protein